VARAPRKIGLLHNIAGGNLGDDATLTAVIQNIKTRWPDAEISGFAMNAEEVLSRHGTHAYDRWKTPHKPGNIEAASFRDKVKIAVSKYRVLLRVPPGIYAVAVGVPRVCFQEVRFLVKSFRLLRSLDVLVISGGQLVESSGGPYVFRGGPWKFPYTTFKWILLARLARVRPIVLNAGVGPLRRPLSTGFVRAALSLSDYASFRDEQSRALVRRIGFKGSAHLSSDSAYGIDVSALTSNRIQGKSKVVVGLAPLAHADPRLLHKRDCAVYHSFIQQVGSFAAELIRNHYCVTLFCTDIGVDAPLVADLERAVKACAGVGDGNSNGSLRRVHQWSTEELLSNMASMDYVVASRFHAVVFAHMLNIPVLAISNHTKVTTLMNDLGLSQYCVDVNKCDADVLGQAFVSLVSNRDEIKSRMAEKLATYQENLSFQFDRAIPLRTAPRSQRIRDLL
jgi:polysaccharide pyruvyl transferase WcaK-like protein